MSDTQTGTVKWFDETKGFGFIAQESGKDIFAHISAVANGQPLVDGQQVEFTVVDGKKGPQAENIKPV